MSVHPLWNDFPVMMPPLEKVSALLRGIVDDCPAAIKDDLSRLLFSNGKMLRPAFVILSSAWGEEQDDHITSIAAAVELLHIASLVHDDVIDKAVTRRGVPTLHETMGVKKAVLAGDYLLSIAIKMAAPGCSQDLIPVFLEGVQTICLGEISQDFHNSNLNIGRDTYFKRIRGKTAELFGLACLAGAQASGVEKDLGDKLYQLGILFGMAFQVEDDILDYTGKEGKLGKVTGKDLKEGIPTLPLIEALEAGDPLVNFYNRNRFLRPFIPGVRKRIVEKGYAARADIIARDYKKQAQDLIGQLPETGSTAAFNKIFSLLDSRSI